jgi:hypothetical protein
MQTPSARLLSLLLVGVACLAPRACLADPYTLGQGLQLGDFDISGYSNLVADSPAPASLSVDDLSLFVSGEVNQWINPFAEFEISGLTLLQAGSAPMHRGELVAERLYDDARVSDSDTLRVGKMLAPVGDWNLIHAAPLVPISSRPLTTMIGFSDYVSGVSWLHDAGTAQAPDWQVYLQPGGEWLPVPGDVALFRFRNLWGGHLSWKQGLSDDAGVSLQGGEQVDGGGRYVLVGANLSRSFGNLKLQSEATCSHWSSAPRETGADSGNCGAFLLGDYALDAQWHLLGEAEDFHSQLLPQGSRNVLLGVDWTPLPALVWKVEYLRQTASQRVLPTGWTLALALLF